MDIQENVPLSKHSTMRLGGPAKYLLDIYSAGEIPKAVAWAKEKNLPIMMIGIGSNIVWQDAGFDGLILVNKISGFEITDNGSEVIATIGAGEIWDKVVEKIVNENLSGVEMLSLIPGTTGATPVQNVGAYGGEISDTLIDLEAYDTKTDEFVTLQNKDCDFSYRKSRFNGRDRSRFFITSIRLKLSQTHMQSPFYRSLEKYLSENNIKDFSPREIRNAVINIRNSKLPDPARVANNGSFFANPIIDKSKAEEIAARFPDLPNWQTADGKVKLSAAWMMENLGLKGYKDLETGMAIWDKHSLVFVNENAKNTAALLEFRGQIIKKVEKKFGVTLKQEPELI